MVLFLLIQCVCVCVTCVTMSDLVSSWISADTCQPQAWLTWVLFWEVRAVFEPQTLRFCLLIPGLWLADNQVGGSAEGANIASAFYQSECVCRLLKLHFRFWSETLSQHLFSPTSSLCAAMRTTVVSVAMVMACVMMVHASVKPQKDFNLQKVWWFDLSLRCINIFIDFWFDGSEPTHHNNEQ